MKIQPIHHYQKPKYPERDIFIQGKNNLTQWMPEAWKRHALISGLLAVFLTIRPMAAPLDASHTKPSEKTVPSHNVFAPAFTYGDSSGTFGLTPSIPTSYLSEVEAWDIITTKFHKAGLSVLSYETVKYLNLADFEFTEDMANYRRSISLKGYCPEWNLGISLMSIYQPKWINEYLSSVINTNPTTFSFSYSSTINDIKRYVEGSSKSLPLNIATFYQEYPHKHLLPTTSEYTTKRNENKVNLEAQVDAFLEWFQNQGYTIGNKSKADGNK